MGDLIREPVVSGMFYPAGKDSLAKMIATLLTQANSEKREGRKLFGLISPHAGYIYSGGCAAYGYKLLKGEKFDTVIVMGPSHYAYLDGASVWTEGFYKTPLGSVPIDKESAQFLLSQDVNIEFHQIAHLQEHSIEVQIPFLQYVLKNNFELVPVVIGNQSLEYANILSDAVVKLLQQKNKKYLLIASSDLSHYHSDEVAKRLDSAVVKIIEKMDVEGLVSLLESGKGEACGAGSIMVLLLAAKKMNANIIDILNVTNSGEVSGDKSRVVGYMSSAIYY